MNEAIALQTCGDEIWATNPNTGEGMTADFEKVFDADASQDSVYAVLGVPCVESVKSGVCSCIFAHGQTGTGKTHSIVGDMRDKTIGTLSSSEDGLLPRMADSLLKERKPATNNDD